MDLYNSTENKNSSPYEPDLVGRQFGNVRRAESIKDPESTKKIDPGFQSTSSAGAANGLYSIEETHH